MAIRGIVSRCLYVEPSPTDTMIFFYEIVYSGPEISTWSGGDWKIHTCIAQVELLGTENSAQMSSKLTDMVVDCLLNSTGIVMARTDAWFYGITKGA